MIQEASAADDSSLSAPSPLSEVASWFNTDMMGIVERVNTDMMGGCNALKIIDGWIVGVMTASTGGIKSRYVRTY